MCVCISYCIIDFKMDNQIIFLKQLCCSKALLNRSCYSFNETMIECIWGNTTGVIQIIDTVVYDDYEYPDIDDYNNILW